MWYSEKKENKEVLKQGNKIYNYEYDPNKLTTHKKFWLFGVGQPTDNSVFLLFIYLLFFHFIEEGV